MERKALTHKPTGTLYKDISMASPIISLVSLCSHLSFPLPPSKKPLPIQYSSQSYAHSCHSPRDSMSSNTIHHPAIVKHRTQTKGHLGDIYIQDFDPKGHYITLVTRPPPKGEDVEVQLHFNPPLGSIFEVRPRLYYWRDEALKHFKVVCISFSDFWFIPLL